MERRLEPLDRSQRIRGAVLCGAVAVVLVGLIGRLIHINLVHGPQLLEMARQQQEATAVIPARRGMILDRRGRVVAASEMLPDVFVDPAQSKDLAQTAEALGARLNISGPDILKILARRPKSRYVIVAQRVDDVTADAVRELRDPAVGLTQSFVRGYPLERSLSHVLGGTGRDGRGLEGVELAFDKHLAGVDGRRTTIRDARRRGLRRGEEGIRYPVDGGHIVLTIDAEIQRIAETALAETVEAFDAEGGVVLVMQPRTGEVLAMATLPNFDPNDAQAFPPDARRNRAVTDPVEPGSTIKGFIAAGALERGFVRPGELFDCEMGTYRQGSRVIRDVHPYGLLDLAGIIKKSSNIGMTKLSERMDKKSMREMVQGFGFGRLTGIECPGEDAGYVTPLRSWGTMTSTSVSFGYEISMTPVQLGVAFCALINDGSLVKPRIIRQLMGPEGDSAEGPMVPISMGRATTTSVAAYIRDELLVGVVAEGTGRGAKLEHYDVLGKTGTAKLTRKGVKGYLTDAYLSTFMGAAPAHDPQVAAIVMVRRPNPAKGYYGGTVSAPAVGKILGDTLAYLEVPPDKTSVALAGH